MIIEYKLHRMEDGSRKKPDFIDQGGFYPASDKTMIGFSPSEANRDYYVPDTVTVLTATELKARVVAEGMLDDQGNAMDQATIEAHVDMILANCDIA